MLNFASHLQWFQAKIGSYDKQIWETSVEQRILQGLENRPKRDGSLHKELIDIDLVRGSTFSKAKPRHGLKSVIFNGLKRVIFFPYYFNQWQDHLNKEVVYLFLFHYVIQLIQLTLYFMWSNSSEIMLEEILLPIVLALCLGVLHAHIIAPYTVKQRRKKTFSTSTGKVKSTSKIDTNTTGLAPMSRQHSVLHPMMTQVSDSSQQGSKDAKKSESVQSCQENLQPNQTKQKVVLFKKSTSNDNDLNAEVTNSNTDKKTLIPEDYDGETEAKDSSFCEREALVVKSVDDDDPGSGLKYGEMNVTMCTEALCIIASSKILSKRIKTTDGGDKAVVCNKNKLNARRFSQSEGVTVTDEEDLKKFITAKNKQIPDPTPISIPKKDKDKSHWKALNSTGQKPYKSSKSRRQTVDWVGDNSGSESTDEAVCNCASVSIESSKTKKSAITESVIAGPSDDIETNVSLNGNVINPDNVTGDSSEDQISSSATGAIETVTGQPTSLYDVIPVPIQQKSSQSQPHTPVNHAENRGRHRIEVRKISSADASPTPSRKTSTLFSTQTSLNREVDLNASGNHHVDNQHTASSNNDQGSLPCLIDQLNTVCDNSISSEDYSSRVADLNEDTITKSHKKRDEFHQLFVKKAMTSCADKVASKARSSTSSSQNSATDTKIVMIKRRRRDDCKSSNVETFHKKKHRKEMVQSMSETEYDRMNSDVNSTGNSTSDGEDICPTVAATNAEQEDLQASELKGDVYQDDEITDIGSNFIAASKNDNNISQDDPNRPIQNGDSLPSEITPDDPFVLWYKEAHTQGSSHGMTGSVSCYIWENDQLKKTNLSLLDIGWSIIQAVERHEQDKSYSSFGLFIIIGLCFTPLFFRMYINRTYLSTVIDMSRHTNMMDIFVSSNSTFFHSLIAGLNINTSIALIKQDNLGNRSATHTYSWTNDIIPLALTSIFASEWPIRVIIVLGVCLRLVLYTMTFLILCVAENSFEQRLQYAKHFCRLTSSRRARKYYLPHFRLNKLANIKCWLSLRSYLKKRGPQRSVDSIISSAFYMLLAMLSLVCVNLLQSTDNLFVNRLINWDLMLCSIALGVFMMRFLILGTNITKKYRNLSVIITEQINLFLAMQTRPHKKEELTLAHNVLRLAESLLKEVEGPFRICGWSMNPFLYNILKVVILSVFSTVLSETCGFKMKLYKIKINPANW